MKNLTIPFFSLLLIMAIGSVNAQSILNIPGDYATIQAAINAASSGDIIEVDAGNYAEAINIPVGKVLTIKGANAGVAAGNNPGIRGAETILDGGFYIRSGSTIDGFTIKNGSYSGSIKNCVTVANNNVTVKNCIIQDVSGSQNNGIETQGTNNFTLENSTIKNNWRGLYLNPGSGHIFTGNLIDANNGVGVGIGSDGLSNFTMTGNTISNHSLEGWGTSGVGLNVKANQNQFLDNGLHIANYGGNEINATCNWYGTADEDVFKDKIHGSIIYFPYKIDDTPDSCLKPSFKLKIKQSY